MPDSSRLLPVLERLRCAPSPGAQRMGYLLALAAELDALALTPSRRLEWEAATGDPGADLVRISRFLGGCSPDLIPSYDRLCFDTAMRLREQGAYLIASGM